MPKRASHDPAARDRELELPSVLLVGAPTAYQAALAGVLDARGHFVELTACHALIRVASTLAPDLIVLLEDSAEACGVECLEQLARVRACAPIPVLVLAEPEALAHRLQAYRLGARAVMRRPASVDAAAAAVTRLVRALPGAGLGELEQIGEVTLDELARAFSADLRKDVLGAAAASDREPPVRLLLDEHEPILSLISEFVQRLRPHVVTTTAAPGELAPDDGPPEPLPGAVRVLLVDDDTTRADVVAQELRAHGLRVLVTGTDPPRHVMLRARQFAPQAIAIDSGCLAGERTQLIRLVWGDVELRWASLVAVRWREVWPDPLRAANLEPVLAGIAEAMAPERLLLQRLRGTNRLTVRLEVTGPGRLLRALVEAPFPLRLRVSNRRVEVEIDLANGLIAGATARSVDGPAWAVEGPPALATLLQIGSGRVRIERVGNPAALNLLCPLDLALAMAQAEPAPIRASRIDGFEAFGAPERDPSPPDEQRPLESDRPTSLSARPFVVPRIQGGRLNRLGRGLVHGAAPARGLLAGAIAMLVIVPAAVLSFHGGEGSAPAARASMAGAAQSAVARSVLVSAAGRAARSRSAEPRSSADMLTAALPASAPQRPTTECPLAHEATTHVPGCAELEGALTEPSSPLHALIAAAQRAVVRGDLPAARVAYCGVARLAPERPGSFTSVARVLLMEGDGRGALAPAAEALRLAPSSRVARELLGDALARSGELERARAEWFGAAGVDARAPAQVKIWLARQRRTARRALAGQRYDLAERAAIRVIVVEPGDSTAALTVSHALAQRNQYARALDWAKHALALAGPNPRPLRRARKAIEALEDEGGAARRHLARLDAEER